MRPCRPESVLSWLRGERTDDREYGGERSEGESVECDENEGHVAIVVARACVWGGDTGAGADPPRENAV